MAKISASVKATIFGNCIGSAMGRLACSMKKEMTSQLYGSFKGELMYNLKLVAGLDSKCPPGYWSDDADLMLLQMMSICDTDGLVSGVQYRNRVCTWYSHGFQEMPDKPTSLVDITIRTVMNSPIGTQDPHTAAQDVWERTGCSCNFFGAVSKTAVLGLYMYQDIQAVIHNTLKICKVTHADPRCQASCVAVTTAIAQMMQSQPNIDIDKIITRSFQYAVDILKRLNFESYVQDLEMFMFITSLSDLNIDQSNKRYNTFTPLGIAIWALRQNSFRDAIEAIVFEGGNADANCGLAGAMLGCKLGMEAIPTEWVDGLLQKLWLEDKINKFTHYVLSPPSDAMQEYHDAGASPTSVITSAIRSATKVASSIRPEKTVKSYIPLETACSPLQLQILAVVYGGAIGDAIGLLTEFLTKHEAINYYGKYKGKLSFNLKDLVGDRHRKAWLVGDWTDDTDQAIVIIESIIYNNGEVHAVDFGRRLKQWACYGFKELGDTMGNGLGATTKSVLTKPEYDTNPIAAAQNVWELSGSSAAPNGAVMRTAVLGVYMYRDINQVIKNTINICKVTHADPRCQASCVAVTTAIAQMLQKKPQTDRELETVIRKSYDYARNVLQELYSERHIKELEEHMNAPSLTALKLADPDKIGYTYKCLGAGFWALRQKDFRAAMEDIVFEGGDADTNGAVAGALLGCKLGFDSLPKEWLDNLRYRKWLDDILEQFLIVVEARSRAAAAEAAETHELTTKTHIPASYQTLPDMNDAIEDHRIKQATAAAGNEPQGQNCFKFSERKGEDMVQPMVAEAERDPRYGSIKTHGKYQEEQEKEDDDKYYDA